MLETKSISKIAGDYGRGTRAYLLLRINSLVRLHETMTFQKYFRTTIPQNISRQLLLPNVEAAVGNKINFFYDEGPYYIETSPLICRAYMIRTSVIKC